MDNSDTQVNTAHSKKSAKDYLIAVFKAIPKIISRISALRKKRQQ